MLARNVAFFLSALLLFCFSSSSEIEAQDSAFGEVPSSSIPNGFLTCRGNSHKCGVFTSCSTSEIISYSKSQDASTRMHAEEVVSNHPIWQFSQHTKFSCLILSNCALPNFSNVLSVCFLSNVPKNCELQHGCPKLASDAQSSSSGRGMFPSPFSIFGIQISCDPLNPCRAYPHS